MFIQHQFDASLSGLAVYDSDPHTSLYGKLHSDSPARLGAADPELDALLDELKATPLADSQEVLSQIDAHIQQNAPFISIRWGHPMVTWQENVHGVVGTNDMLTYWGKAWISS